jgi:hypothetical protein
MAEGPTPGPGTQPAAWSIASFDQRAFRPTAIRPWLDSRCNVLASLDRVS